MSVLISMISDTALADNLLVTPARAIQSRRGIIDEPKCRAFLCTVEGGALNINCGQVEWDPQSWEGPKGFPYEDRWMALLSARVMSGFAPRDEQSADRWHKEPLKTGNNVLHWRIEVQHRTESWQLYITREDWDPNQPLSRAQFDLRPLYDKSADDEIPPESVTIEYTIPENYSGYYVLFAVWNVADTGNASYQAIDTEIS